MPTSSEYAVEVRDLVKTYRLGEMDVLHGSLRDAIMRAARRPFRREEREELEALAGVSSLVVFAAGLLYFKRLERVFADIV